MGREALRRMSVARARATAIAFMLLVLAASASCTGTPATGSVSPSVLSPTPTPSQMSAEAREYLEFALSKIRMFDFYAREANWPSLEQGAYLRASGAADSSGVYPAIQWVLRSLGDGHGYVFPSDGLDDLEGFFHRTTQPSARLVGQVAVLRLPSFGWAPQTRAAHQYVAAAWRALRTMTTSCGWVLDLRNDLGGDVYPMLGAVASFLEVRKPLGFLSASGDVDWVRVHEGAMRVFFRGGTREQTFDYGSPPIITPRRVAVLIGPDTMSAGEATLVALLSQSGVRTFGLPTAGAAGSPKRITMPDGAELWVTVSIDVDAMRTPYPAAIAPDVQVGDKPLAEARDWLLSRC
jgi:carboxyl-terminal processing protease